MSNAQRLFFSCILISVFVMTWISNASVMLHVPLWIVVDALAVQVLFLGVLSANTK